MTRTPPRTDLDLRSLWFGLLAGPIVWSIYFLVGYGLIEVACRLELWESQVMGITALSSIILLLTLVAFLVTLFAGFLAYRNWRPGKRKTMKPEGAAGSRRLDWDSGQFMASAGLQLSALFSFLILVTGLPALVMPPCG